MSIEERDLPFLNGFLSVPSELPGSKGLFLKSRGIPSAASVFSCSCSSFLKLGFLHCCLEDAEARHVAGHLSHAHLVRLHQTELLYLRSIIWAETFHR